ncbi:MAG: hypothetical protein LUH21_26480 [Clostridiales bacterium]|nr:hypothetical protein [Clostridiales bacterium]
MNQLLKVTSIPFQAICFTQNARLLPADSVTLERQKALARHNALKQRYQSGSSAIDFDYINQVNKAFSEKHSPGKGTAPQSSPRTAASGHASSPPARLVAGQSASHGDAVSEQPVSSKAASIEKAAKPAGESSAEISSSYTVQRGSFELRVAKGELSYIPPLAMTIVTQYPDVEFEYVGGFHYFPSDEESSEATISLTI